MSKRHKGRFKQALDAKREALTRAAKQPKPAGWDDPTPGNPYTDSYRAMERERIEGEVRENRERDRAEVEHLNSPEVRGITGA